MNTRMDPTRLHIGTYTLAPYAQTEAHIRDLAACGIDLLVCLRAGRPVLDLLHKYGVGAVLSGAVPGWFGGKGENAGTMEAERTLAHYEEAAKNFEDHPAVWGIDCGDEPSSLDFPHYGKILQRVEELFPNQFAYLNIYPAYAMLAANTPQEVREQLGCDTYKEYIDRYCRHVPMDYLCLDHYVYSSTKENLHETMGTAAEACRKTDRRLWTVLQVNSSDPEKWISIPQLRFQAYTALAYGSEVLTWACYTAGWWHNFVVDKEGNKTEQYEKLKAVNCEILAIAEEYMRYKNTATHQTNGCLSLPWATLTGDAMTAGEMTARDGSGKTALLLAPADETADCHVTLSAPGKKLTLHAGSETTQLLPDADGCCGFVLKDGMGVLLTAE